MNRNAHVVVSVVMLCAVSITCADQAPNVPPTAAIDVPGQDTTVALGEQMNFQGSADDADGSVAGHAWVFGDGNQAAVEDPGAHLYAAAGVYTVTYQVTDDEGAASIPDSIVVTIHLVPTSSIDNPGQDTTVTLGDAVDFQGSAEDVDGSVVSHAWSFDDGNGATVEDPGAYIYLAHGSYTVTYRVTDDRGATSRPDSVVVTVNQIPSAVIVNPGQDTTARWPYAVEFHGTASDVDGTIVSHRWDFGDGNTADVEDPGPYAYAAEGTYTVTYEVTDDDGAVSSQAVVQVTVAADGIAPEPGGWFGGAEFGFVGFNVNAQGTAIADVHFIFEGWSCGGVTWDGRLSSSVPAGWPIADGAFTIESSFASIGLTVTMHGTFDSNIGASGSWTAVSFGTTCSGQWQVDKSPPAIQVFMSPDFESQGILGFGWITGRHVALEIDNGADGTVDFQATTRVDGEGVARFQTGPYAVAEGDSVTMYDAVNLLTYHVLYITLESVDTDADLVSGSAREGTRLLVGVYDPSNPAPHPEIWAIADATGAWSVSFAGIYDILPATPGWAKAIGSGGNTAIHW